MSDAELVRRSQEGDDDAFRELVERYREVLFGTAYLLARDRGRAEDLVQEALVRAWKGMGSLRSDGNFKAWAVRILVNGAMSKQRKKRLHEVPLEEAVAVPRGAGGVEEEVLLEEERERLRHGVEALQSEQREVVVLRYYSELSLAEIARVLGCREGTVKSRLHRALRHLGHTLSAENPRVELGEGA